MNEQLIKKIFCRILTVMVMTALLFIVLEPSEADAAAVKKPGQVKALKAVPISSSGIKVTWARTKGAKGYQVYMAASKHGRYKKIKTVKSYKKVNYTKTSLKKNKKYWFKVRAYRTGSKKTIYGKFSSVKAAKANHKHHWVNHSKKVKKTRSVIEKEWDEKILAGYDKQKDIIMGYECLMCGYRIGGVKYKDVIKCDAYQNKVSVGTASSDPNSPYLLAHAMGSHWQDVHMGSWEAHEEFKAWCESQPKNEDGSVTQSVPIRGDWNEPRYKTQHKVKYRKETYYKTVTDYQYCKGCKKKR